MKFRLVLNEMLKCFFNELANYTDLIKVIAWQAIPLNLITLQQKLDEAVLF